MENSNDNINALDHYVPQTYLKQWICKEHGRLHVFNKEKQKPFMPMPKGICAERGGSTNEFLDEPRQMELFLKSFESQYLSSVAAISNGNYDKDNIVCISKLIAAVNVCSPTARRLHMPFMKKFLETSARAYDNHRDFIRPLGRRVSDLIDSGRIQVEVNERYPESIAMDILDEVVAELTNSKWTLFINRKDEPFITSDFPIAIGEHSTEPRFNSKLFPLSPTLAVKIEPDINSEMDTESLRFFSFRRKEITTNVLKDFNQKIAKCSETMIIYMSHKNTFLNFLERHCSYRIEQKVEVINQRRGAYVISKNQISKSLPAEKKNSNIPAGRWFNFTLAETRSENKIDNA